MRVFLVNHGLSQRCGVFQHGARVARILSESTRHEYIDVVADDVQQLLNFGFLYGEPDVVVYNYHPVTLGWAPYAAMAVFPRAVHVGTMHDGPTLDALKPSGAFAHWIWHDPSIGLLKDVPDNMHWTPRPLPTVQRYASVPPSVPFTIGTFGFALGGKGFERVIAYGREQGAHIRIHAPEAYFGGGDPFAPNPYLESLRADDVTITTGFLTEDELLLWCAQNDENALLYDYNWGRGISSACDFLISASRPMTLSDSSQFRHVHAIVHGSFSPYRHTYDSLRFQEMWSNDRFRTAHDEIIDRLMETK